MKTQRAIFAPKTVRLIVNITAQKQSTNIISWYSIDGGYLDIGTTSDTNFTSLFINKYTVDFSGTLIPINIRLVAFSNNDSNAESEIQISGDRGNTFISMTDGIPSGALITRGPGTWIDTISTGYNALQIRFLGRSTDGNPATIRLRGDSYVDLTITKKLQ